MENNLITINNRINPLKDKPIQDVIDIYTKWSASKYKTFLECPRKFYFSYIDKLPKQDTEIFTFGGAVHYGLELVNKSKLFNSSPITDLDYEMACQGFREFMSRATNDSSIVHDLSLFEEGEKLIRNELDRRRADSLPEKIIGVEQEFDLEFADGVRIVGYIDKIIQLDDSTIKIVDYKTSKTALSWNDARTDEQLSMYDLAAIYLFPQFPQRVIELNYLRLSKTVTSTRTDVQRYSFRQQLLAAKEGLSRFINNIKNADSNFIPEGKLSTFCAWCQFKHSCSTYTDSLIQVGTAFNMPEITPQSFIKIYKDIKNSMTELENYKKELTKWALQHLDAEWCAPISDGAEEVYTLSNSNRTYDPNILAQHLSLSDLLSCVDVSNSKLDQVLNTVSSETASIIQQSAQYRLQSPQIRTRKVKK